ncbi:MULTISPECIES: hypothetical protein [unclassified Sphingopyxis]|uniref:hypothetical protein n=1 Tax=unclassified Sphingopyxis TaxID=2614943 RepID=UPI0007377F3E|nr:MULTISPECIES: hypothetical protein [unclassified Sphingopyxis]KTE25694.1 hypothetical protein ATE62_22265 [Sphingopyxis sp. HIX]KTE73330.1 hypothetical protein ATE72_21955 [Sphingopyxis sp. HXXIV]
MSLLLALAMAAAPEPVFDCAMGKKRLTVTQEGGALVYRYGTRQRAELRMVADAASGRVHYHRTLYPRGEDQTLRFVNGDYSYVVYAHYSAPGMGMTEEGRTPERTYGGLIVLKNGEALSSRRCNGESGDMREWPIFKTLPVDADNLTPEF